MKHVYGAINILFISLLIGNLLIAVHAVVPSMVSLKASNSLSISTAAPAAPVATQGIRQSNEDSFE